MPDEETIITEAIYRGLGGTLPYCSLCGNVNRADLGPVTGMCLDGRACRRRQAGVEPVNPDGGTDA